MSDVLYPVDAVAFAWRQLHGKALPFGPVGADMLENLPLIDAARAAERRERQREAVRRYQAKHRGPQSRRIVPAGRSLVAS